MAKKRVELEDFPEEEDIEDNKAIKELDLNEEPIEPEEIDYDQDLDQDMMGYNDGLNPLKKHEDLLKDLTNYAPFLKDLVNSWLGLSWDETKKEFIKNISVEPIMNVHCATWCIGFLKTYARGNNIITNINKEEYQNIMMDVIETAWLNIGTRTQEFGIKDDGDILRVCTQIEHTAALVLMGAGDGKYNEFLGTVTTRHENITPMQMPYGGVYGGNPMIPQPKRGMFERVKKVFLGS